MRRTSRLSLTVAAMALATTLQAQTTPPWAAALDSVVRREMARTGTPGVSLAVVVDGRIAYAQGYGVTNVESAQPVTRETLFRVGSVTKMFTGALLAQLEAEGLLDLDAPIGRTVPELRGRVAQTTTLQLLTHSAGWRNNAVPYGRMGESALGEVMREVTDTLFIGEPGTFRYSNPGFSMAGYVAEVAGDARYATQVTQRLLRPTGMQRATFKPLEALTWSASQGHLPGPTGAPTLVRPFTENTAQWAAGFLMASAEEVARFSVMLMDSGRVDGREVLAPAAWRRMTTPQVALPEAAPGGRAQYGLGLVIREQDGATWWGHSGSITGFDAEVVMRPDRRRAVVLIDNRAGAPLQGVIDAALRLSAPQR
jgi:CubicO group peptidase (beta-lactamase class C family)